MSGFIRRLFSILVKHKTRQTHKNRRLLVESMEGRRLMASDLGAISGTVFTDLTDNGLTTDDALISGATVRLFRDGGNGTFDNGGADDTAVGTPQTTNASGAYTFNNLEAGRYYVQQSAVSGRLQRTTQTVQTVVITATQAAGVAGTTIDTFNTTNQSIVANSGTPTASSTVVTATGEAIGNERDVVANHTSGGGDISVAVTGGLLRVSPDGGTAGTGIVTYDGQDANATVINNTNGLNNTDLTSGGTNVGFLFKAGSEAGNTIRVTVFSSPTNFSTFTSALPTTPGAVATEDFLIRFTDFVADPGGTGANFSSVNAIRVEINVVAAADAQIDFTQTVARSIQTVNFANLNPMSLGNLVFNDRNNNSTLDTGDPGISNVRVELYSDTNGNGSFGAGDTLVGSTNTDTNGNYTFGNLFPGEYIVLVPQSQFNAGQALSGFRTSTDPSPDPDIVVVDNDDNGNAIAAVGVATAAFTLASGSEPTNDGDTDANSNNTIDFGFAPQIDLQIDKTANATTVSAGNQVTYSLVARNSTTSATANNVRIVDDLPAGVTIVSATSTLGTVTQPGSATGEIQVDIPSLTAGQQATVTIVVAVPASQAAGTITNSATITGDGQETDNTNNTDSVGVTVNRVAALTLTKADAPDPVGVGGNLTYTFTVTNTGPSTATNVVVSDTLPTGLSNFGSPTFTSGTGTGSVTSGVMTVNIPTLAVNGSATFTLGSTVLTSFSGTTVANTATAVATEAPQVTANASTAINPAVDLSITKSDSVDPVNRGSTLVYTIGVQNAGPSAANNVVIVDTLPTGVTFVSATGGTVTAPTGSSRDVSIALANPLASGGSATVTITVTVDQNAPATFTNTAVVRSTESVAGLDTNTANNTVSIPTATQATIDLQITKNSSAATITPGNTVTYTLLVTNNGPTTADLVNVTDNLPDGIRVTSATSTQGTVTIPPTAQDTIAANNDNLTVALGTLANQGTATITIVATVLPESRGNLLNQSSVATANTTLTESNTQNNAASNTLTLTPSIDLVVTKADSVSGTVVAGNQMTYTITVSNTGPSTATNVSLTDTLPTGVTFVSGTSSTGAAITSAGLASGLSLGSLAPNGTATVTLLVGVDGATRGNLSNTARATAAETETNTTNNAATVQTTINPSIDLAITKTDSQDTIVSGNQLTYTIQVTNNGPSTATNVVVSDTLPTGLTFVSGASTNGGTVTNNNGVITASIPTLARNATATITLVTSVARSVSGTITNTSTVTATETDSVPANNSDSEPTSVTQALASISGNLYRDTNRNNVRDTNEVGLSGVTITLTGTNSSTSGPFTVVTNANGDYLFENLAAGEYVVSRPDALGAGSTQPGPGTNGTAGTSRISTLGLTTTAAPSNNLAIFDPLSKRMFLSST